MKTSDYMDKKVTGLSRSRSDDFSDTHYAYDYEEEQEPSSPTFSFSTSHHHHHPHSSFTHSNSMDRFGLEELEEKKLRSSSFEEALLSLIDRRMKEHNDKVLNAVEGVSAQICQLETRTHKLENAIDGLKMAMEYNHGKVDGKLRELENVLRQVENYIRDLRDKQDIAETQMKLFKLQLSKAELQEGKKNTAAQSKAGEKTPPGSVTSLQEASPPPPPVFVSPQQPYTSSTPPPNILQPPTQKPQNTNHQTPQNTIPPSLQQQSSYQPPVVSSEIARQQYHKSPILGSQPAHSAFHSLDGATPQLMSIAPVSSIQYSQPMSSGVDTADGSRMQPQQIPLMLSALHSSTPIAFHLPDEPRPQSLQAPQMQVAHNFQGTSLAFQPPSGPTLQAQTMPQYLQMPQSQFPSMPKSQQPPDVVHPQSRYSYGNEFARFPSQDYSQNPHNLAETSFNVPPSQRFETSLTKFPDQPPSRAYSDSHSTYAHLPADSSYKNLFPFGKSAFNVETAADNSSRTSSSPIPSERSGYSNLPTAQALPPALPTASFISSESSSDGPGKRVADEDIVDKVVAMGFRRDVVRATVKKLTEKGKSVDLNVVLDILMNDGQSQSQNNRTGR